MATPMIPGTWSQPLREWLSLQQAALVHGSASTRSGAGSPPAGSPASRFGVRLIRVRTEDVERLVRAIPIGNAFTRRRRA